VLRMGVDDAADAAAQLEWEREEDNDAADSALEDAEDAWIIAQELDHAHSAAALWEQEEVDAAKELAATMAAETPEQRLAAQEWRDYVTPPAEKPLPRVPPTEGLDGKYWTPPTDYTVVKVPEPWDELCYRDLARREGRFVGRCMFCQTEYREVDFQRGLLVYGHCKLWCVDATKCSERMESARSAWKANMERVPPAPEAREPDMEAYSCSFWARIQATRDAREANFASLPPKRVRISARRRAPGASG
jgi:hypothetical protein